MPVQTVIAAGATPAEAQHRPVARKARARAPLRLGLAGGGTDVSPYCERYGGLVLNATIDRYCYSTVEGRMDGRTVFRSADIGVEAEPGASDLLLHQAVYRRVCADFVLGSPPLTLTTVADAPPGSGLGSSSTLVVSCIEAFREYFALPLDDYEVAALAYSVERDDCGLRGGRQDQYAATFGGFNVMEFATDGKALVSPLRIRSAIVQEFEASIVLYYSGVSRESASIIHEQAGHVHAGSPEQVEATHRLKTETVQMRDALVVGDLGKVAEVIEAGWQAKKRLASRISTSRIESALAAAREGGALAGKVSGAGGGGYLIFLVDPVRRPAVLGRLASLGSGRVEPAHFVSEGAVAWTVR